MYVVHARMNIIKFMHIGSHHYTYKQGEHTYKDYTNSSLLQLEEVQRIEVNLFSIND